jgi:hypothetical protein
MQEKKDKNRNPILFSIFYPRINKKKRREKPLVRGLFSLNKNEAANPLGVAFLCFIYTLEIEKMLFISFTQRVLINKTI